MKAGQNLGRMKMIEHEEDKRSKTVINEEVVVDEMAYKKYNILMKTTTYKNKYMTASDGMQINLNWFPFQLKKKISHLPREERDTINELYKKREELRGRINALKQQAHGASKILVTRSAKGIKFLYEKKEEVIELFSRMFTPQEVHKTIVEQYGVPCNMAAVVLFRRNHLNVINEGIEKFKKDFSDLRLSHKKGRLEELVWLYNRAKHRFEVTGANADRDFLLKVLEQVRKEVDGGDILKIEGNIDINIESVVNVHLRKEVMSEINLQQIIVGRVAAMMSKHPATIISQLLNSHYQKFNALMNPDVDVETVDTEYEDMSYPSTRSYDFDEIRKKQKLLAEESKQQAILLKAQQDEKEASGEELGLKEALLKKLKLKRKEIDQRQIDVQQSYLETEVRRAESDVDKKVKPKEKKPWHFKKASEYKNK